MKEWLKNITLVEGEIFMFSIMMIIHKKKKYNNKDLLFDGLTNGTETIVWKT